MAELGLRAVLHKSVGQADALDALPAQGSVVDEEFQHGGRKTSGKGVFLGEQYAGRKRATRSRSCFHAEA